MRANLSRRQMNTDMEEVEEAREYVGGGVDSSRRKMRISEQEEEN